CRTNESPIVVLLFLELFDGSLYLSLKLTQNETHERLKLISEFCTLPTKTETIEKKFLVKTWLAATRMGNGI
ncbi:Uncharacterized protein APZ42_008876, partial [Daphnia magna]